MQKTVSLGPLRATVAEPVQIELFAVTDDPRFTNTIDLWDIAPRFVFYTDKDAREAGKYLSSVEREFLHNGKAYRLVLKPARIRRDGKEIEEYPGEREQLVEEVIRKLAVEPGRLHMRERDQVAMNFSLYEIREELSRRSHSFRTAEIKEALQILRHAEIEISRVATGADGSDDVTSIVATSTFPQITFRERGRDLSESSIQFNWFVAQALKHLQFRLLNYEVVMNLRDPVARWLYKRLHHTAVSARGGLEVQEITAVEIHRDCGLADRARFRDVLRRIGRSVELLKAEGIIKAYDAVDVLERSQGRPRKADIRYTLRVSEAFIEQASLAHERWSEAAEDYRAVVGAAPAAFVRLDAQKRDELRVVRAKRRSARRAEASPPRLALPEA
ncbi:MAG TPA: hypothetical protein VGU24_01070 [Microvirga sp.]|jgi:hypothetical protein|nr:hypothetical protein [Microvirga sp.]